MPEAWRETDEMIERVTINNKVNNEQGGLQLRRGRLGGLANRANQSSASSAHHIVE